MKHSPIESFHQAAQAEFSTIAGMEMPAHYGDPRAEYDAACNDVVVIDRSVQGTVEVTGPDAPQFLHNLTTNDIENLPIGGGCEAYFCDHRAKVIAQVRAYHTFTNKEHAIWLDLNPGMKEKVLKHLDKYLISEQAEFQDRTEQYAQFHLAGPKAAETLGKAITSVLPDLAEFQHVERMLGNATICQIRRNDPLGVPGYDVVCSTEQAIGVWRLFLASGARPAGQQVFETLRIENGTPMDGIDLDENRFVMETSRALRAVNYAKGCYLGQEPIVMSRDRAGFVNRAFIGVKIIDGQLLASGTKLFAGDQEVGLVTSCVFSPRLQAGLALAYIRRGNQDPSTRLTAKNGSDLQTVEVLPFPPVT
jgi:tRNA-modifying protein YgfZ